MNEIIKKQNNKSAIDLLLKSFDTLSKNSQLVYNTAINQYLNYFNIDLEKIGILKYTNVIDYIKYLDKNYSHSAFNLKITAIRQFYQKSSELFKINNPFEKIKKLNIKTHKKTKIKVNKAKCLNIDDVTKLLNYYNEKLKSDDKRLNKFSLQRNKILFKLIFEHGLRISEGLNIKITDIEKIKDDEYHIILWNTKNKDDKPIIKIDFFLYNAMCKLYETMKNKNNYIFVDLHNKRITRNYAYQELRKIGLRVLNKKIHPHLLRHSFATELYKLSKDILGISSYLRHKDAYFTAKQYTHHDIELKELRKLRVPA